MGAQRGGAGENWSDTRSAFAPHPFRGVVYAYPSMPSIYEMQEPIFFNFHLAAKTTSSHQFCRYLYLRRSISP